MSEIPELDQIRKINKKLKEEQSKYDSLKGRLEANEKLLKDNFGISTLKEAEELLEKKEKELSMARNRLTTKLAEIEKKYV